jgi:hypothetical protein
MQYRQGDILITKADDFEVGEAKEVKPKNKKLILAEGELTGHHHYVNETHARMYTVGAMLYLLLEKTKLLRHQEHKQITLPPGKYKITRQREYTPEEIRNVAD